MIEAAWPGPWCSECGDPATADLVTLDPDRPIGRCRRGCQRVQGRSRVILTYLAAERLDAQRRHHRRMATRQHFRHAKGGYTSAYCDRCNALGWAYPPAEPGTPAAGVLPAAVQSEGGP